MEAQIATLEDFQNYLVLAREVEPFFGPMENEPSFRENLERAIHDGRAYCVREQNGKPGTPLRGGVMVSKKHNEIAWLAVATRYRRQGSGALLLQYAIKNLDSSKDMSVRTFDETTKEGRPARRLYQRFGFQEHERSELNPAGIPTVVMVRSERR